MLPYHICLEGIVLKVYGQPGAKESDVSGLFQDRIKIACSPVAGKANEDLCKFIYKFTGVL